MSAHPLDGPATPDWHGRFSPTQRAPYSLSLRIRRGVWALVSATLFRFSPLRLRGFRRLLLRVFGATVDQDVSIHNTASVDSPWNLKIGTRASIGERAWVYALDQITIGPDTCVGQGVYLLTGSHDTSSPTFALVTKSITIGEGCWIATRAVVLPGVEIGDFAVVGAGAVVTKAIPSATICGGNPCVPLRPRRLRPASPG